MKCACPPRLRHRVTIERPKSSATVGAGGLIDLTDDANWEEYARPYANILTRGGPGGPGGSERWKFNQAVADVDRIFVMRSSVSTRGIKPQWRLTFMQDGVRKVAGISIVFDVNGERQWVEVHTTEVVT